METRSKKRAPPPSSSASSSSSKRSRSTTSKTKTVNNSRSSMDRSKGKERHHPESSSRAPQIDHDPNKLLGLISETPLDRELFDDGTVQQNLSSASTALQGLLRKLGAGFDDLLPAGALSAASSSQQSGRLKRILSGIRADGEEGRQVEALTQLCEVLSIGTEDSLASFPIDSFVPVLVGLLNYEGNPDVMLLAARALTHLCDVLPSSCSVVVHYGAVPLFCARLLTIEYMDLAEQSLQALKKISQEHPTACLRAGALLAVLQYLDFFSTGVQRVALSTAANMCKKLPSDAADFVMDAVPLLTNLFNYHDAKVLEYASACLTSISEAFASSPDKLDDLCNHGLVAQAASLISISNSGGQAALSPSTYAGLIRLLSTCASGSPLAAKTLLLLGISGTLKDILSGSGLVAGASVPPALARPPEQIYEIVNLADVLLPPLHKTISLVACADVPVKVSSIKRSSSSTSKQDEPNEMSSEASARKKLLQEQPELLQQFGMDLLPDLTQVYTSSVNSTVRHKCLSIIGKLMYFSSADMIQCLLGVTNISSFLAGILTLKDPNILLSALQIAEILMEKLPGTFSKMFIREGVVHAIDSLIFTDTSTSSPVQASNSEKDPDSFAGLSSRSRRYRRRSGGLNAENLGDDSKVPLRQDGPTSPVSVEVPSGKSCSQHRSVCAVARSFKDKYFPTDPSAPEAGVTDDLLRLKNICSKLSSCVENVKTKAKGKSKATGGYSIDISATTEEHLNGIIKEMLFELSKYDGVSTFEFIGSGVILALLNYLSCGTFGKEKVPESVFPKLRQKALRRYKLFIATALPLEHNGNEAPMTVLVQKLQKALSSLERFPVVLSNPPRSSNGTARLTAGINTLLQPIKLRLCRAHGEKSLRDFSSTVVLIDPMATIANVEDFLWSRVQRFDAGQKSSSAGNSDLGPATAGDSTPISTSSAPGRRPSTRSRSAVTIGGPTRKDTSEGNRNSSKGKGKAVLKSSNDEVKGPQTRNATRRRAASDKDKNIKSARDDSSSEDEELNMARVDMDDALIIEQDDISDDEDDDSEEVLRDDSLPVIVPDDVHDVKLGDTDDVIAAAGNDNQAQSSSGSGNRVASGRTDSTEFRSGSTFGSRGTMSFAAAAMSGFASVSGQGIRGGRAYRGLASGSGASDKLIFTVNGKRLSKNLTIYQAFQQQLVPDEEECERYNGSDLSNDGSRFWSDVFTITYQKADVNYQGSSASSTENSTTKSLKSSSTSNAGSDTQWKHISLLDSILQGELPCALDKSNPTYNILALLRVLEGLNQLASRLRVQAAVDDFSERNISTLEGVYRSGSKVPPEEFVNNKITPKLARQLQDALVLCSGSLPSWCSQMTKACPFLFPFETRRQFFYSTAFGLARALNRLQQQQHADNHSLTGEREVRVGRLQRQKVRVARNRILDSAAKVMEMYSSQKAVLEVEYFGEVGTGLGPTLEFYTLLSHDLQKAVLGLWRSSSASANFSMQIDVDEASSVDQPESTKRGSYERRDLVQAPLGLFPRPWSPNADTCDGQLSKVIEYFRLIGRVIAKALQDGRLLDLPLSTPFYKLILGQELDMHDILLFDAELGKVLQEMQALVSRKKFLEETNNEKEIGNLRFRGASIEDLCLDFTLPGYPDFSLKEQGESTMVDINSLEEYITLVVHATLRSGISRQMEAFISGFNQVFDISALQIFSPHELDFLLCGRRELWEPETLVDNIKFDHGYTAKSPAIINLLEILGEMTAEQQQAFCQFVTGAPRLPPGGLAALNPKLTIVRKHSTPADPSSNGTGASETSNHDLPSVMTCANYLKLPPYATKEIMYEKLLYAINEGQGSFDLS